MKQSNFMKIYIIPMMLISPSITISCNSWFSIWMMMELNLMTFIPMIIYFNKFYKNLAMKYFLIQSISSSIMILSANNILISMNKMYFMFIFMLNLSLLIKLGAPPFQYWFINLMKNMNWINCLILSTWQKIIPMMMLMYIMNKMMMMITILFSSIIGAIMGLNHQSLRIIFSYSSINHMSWMMLNLMISEMMWMLYFITYMIINYSIMMMFHFNKIFFINQIMNINFKFKKMFIFINMISISGLPPFIGFNIKWLSLYFFIWNKFYIINLLMMMMSIFTFMFYARISISFMMLSNFKNKLILMNKFFNKNNNFNIFIISSLNFNLWIMSIWIF